MEPSSVATRGLGMRCMHEGICLCLVQHVKYYSLAHCKHVTWRWVMECGQSGIVGCELAVDQGFGICTCPEKGHWQKTTVGLGGGERKCW